MSGTRAQEDWLARDLLAGSTAPLDAARDYHETTKLTAQSNLRLVARVTTILGDAQIFRSVMRAWKSYASCARVPLPRATPSGRTVEEILSAPRPGLGRDAARRVTVGELASVLRLSYGPTGMKPMRGYPDETQYYRASASSGGLYPLEIYPVVHDVDGLAPGIYHYDVHGHELAELEPGDARERVARTLWDGAPLGDVTLIICAVLPRTMSKYLFHGYRFALYDTGALLSSLTASAAAVGLGAQLVDGFLDDELAALVGADGVDEQAVALLALGASAAGVRP